MQTELKATALAVRHWRREHPEPMVNLAIDLQRRVVKLLEDHSWDAVCKVVGISRSQLGVWRRTHGEDLGLKSRKGQHSRKPSTRKAQPRRREAAPPPTFVELAIPSEPPRPEIEVKLPTGVVVCARNGADLHAVGELVASLLTAAKDAA